MSKFHGKTIASDTVPEQALNVIKRLNLGTTAMQATTSHRHAAAATSTRTCIGYHCTWYSILICSQKVEGNWPKISQNNRRLAQTPGQQFYYNCTIHAGNTAYFEECTWHDPSFQNTFNTAWTLKYVMRSEIHAGSHRIPEEQYIPERAENESTKPNRHMIRN